MVLGKQWKQISQSLIQSFRLYLSARVPLSGCTWEFAAMVNYVRRVFPQTLLVVVGFSLGGNVVCKFLGEKTANQERVLCCVSVCQGYSALRWENEGRRAAWEKSQSQENKCVCVCVQGPGDLPPVGPVPAALQLCAGHQHEEAHPVTQVKGLTLAYNPVSRRGLAAVSHSVTSCFPL